jgi:hypothetical protein
MNAPRGVLLFCAVLLAAGCSSVSVSHDFDPKVDFASLRTYGWISAPKSTSSDSIQRELASDSLIEGRVKKAVNQQLALKGLRETTQNPDFLVAFHTGVEDKTDIQSWGYGYGYWGMGGGGISTINYQQGTLILDFVDPKTQNLIWRGVGKEVLSGGTSPEKRQERINDAVQAILKKYPPSS